MMRQGTAVVCVLVGLAAPAAAKSPAKVALALKTAGYTGAKILAAEPPSDGHMAVSVADAFLKKRRQIIAIAPLTVGMPQVVVLDDDIVRPDAKVAVALRTFLTAPDLVEVEITTSWKMPGGGGYSDTMHYVVRRRAAALELVCNFEGNSLLASPKDEGRRRTVVLRPVDSEEGDRTVRFDLSYDDVGRDEAGVREKGVMHFEIAESGMCKSKGAPAHKPHPKGS